MHLAFAAEAAELSVAYGDFGERFYNSLESSAEKFLDYAKLHPKMRTSNDWTNAKRFHNINSKLF